MRSDYSLYIVGIVFFLITAASYAMLNAGGERTTWMVATTILGILFVSLGFTFRPKPASAVIHTQTPPPTQPPTPVTAIQPVRQNQPPVTVQETKLPEAAPPPILELAKVRGIGAKRAEELKTLGISSMQDLANASPSDLATRLNVSPRIAKLWVGQARKLLQNN